MFYFEDVDFLDQFSDSERSCEDQVAGARTAASATDQKHINGIYGAASELQRKTYYTFSTNPHETDSDYKKHHMRPIIYEGYHSRR